MIQSCLGLSLGVLYLWQSNVFFLMLIWLKLTPYDIMGQKSYVHLVLNKIKASQSSYFHMNFAFFNVSLVWIYKQTWIICSTPMGQINLRWYLDTTVIIIIIIIIDAHHSYNVGDRKTCRLSPFLQTCFSFVPVLSVLF